MTHNPSSVRLDLEGKWCSEQPEMWTFLVLRRLSRVTSSRLSLRWQKMTLFWPTPNHPVSPRTKVSARYPAWTATARSPPSTKARLICSVTGTTRRPSTKILLGLSAPLKACDLLRQSSVREQRTRVQPRHGLLGGCSRVTGNSESQGEGCRESWN